MSDARKRAEEALAKYKGSGGCAGAYEVALALDLLLADPAPPAQDEVTEAAEVYRRVKNEADSCLCPGDEPCRHECFQREMALAFADVVLAALDARGGGDEVGEAAESSVISLEATLCEAARSLLGSPAHIGMWDAIQRYCSERNLVARENAVVDVEVAVRLYAARLLSALAARGQG